VPRSDWLAGSTGHRRNAGSVTVPAATLSSGSKLTTARGHGPEEGRRPGGLGGPLRVSSVDEMSMPSTVLHPADPRWGLADQMPDCSHGTWSVATRWGDLIQKGDTEAPSGPIAIQADPRRAWVGRHHWAYARRRARESRADRQAASATARCNQPRRWRAHASG
jgi:hypothetical protein